MLSPNKAARQRAVVSEVLFDNPETLVSEAEVIASTASRSAAALAASTTPAKLRVQPVPACRTFADSEHLDPATIHGAEAGFDDLSTEPKVCVPHEARPGQVPRKVEIERCRRLYAGQDLEALLLERGIDHAAVAADDAPKVGAEVDWMAAKLPLEPFDNTEFEVLSAEAWLAKGVKDGAMRGLPATALQDGLRWTECLAVAHHADTNRWRVVWGTTLPPREGAADAEEGTVLPRMHVRFTAENPANFADRLAAAHALRREAALTLRHGLVLDCMPTDELPSLDSEQQSRVLRLALSPMALRHTALDTSAIIAEIGQQTMRSMNGIVLHSIKNKNTKTNAEKASAIVSASPLAVRGKTDEHVAALVNSLSLPEPPATAPPPPRGTIELLGASLADAIGPADEWASEPHEEATATFDFDQRMGAFIFSSFLTKPEIIKIVVAVRAENQKVMNLNLYNLVQKSMRLEEFVKTQTTSCAAVQTNLKEVWMSAIRDKVKASLKDERKGWFNINETNNEVYGFSKLKKVLTFVNFMAQDTTRFLLEANLQAYAKFLLTCAEPTVTVRASNDVTVEFPSKAVRSKPPLFMTDLVAVGEGTDATYGYSTKLDAFFETPLRFLDEGISMTQNIVTIERRIMQKLFWSHDPVMSSVSPSEGWVADLKESVSEALQEAIVPLREYLTKYDEFLELLRLDEAAYLEAARIKYAGGFTAEEIEAADGAAMGSPRALDADGLRKLALEHIASLHTIEEKVPESINLGLFVVSCSRVRKLLTEKHASIATGLLDMLSKSASESATKTVTRFETIMTKLGGDISTIEAVTELTDFIAEVPAQMTNLQPEMDMTMENFSVLEGVQYKLQPSDFNLRWQVYGWPKRVTDKIDEVEAALAAKANAYQLEMEKEQVAFDEKLKSLQSEVANLRQFTSLAHVDQVAEYVRRIRKDLDVAGVEAATFNSREALFGVEVTEYDLLKEVSKSFEPYMQMWDNIDKWIKWHKSWLTEPFPTLDPETIDRNAGQVQRALLKSCKFFEREKLTDCFSVASTIKEQVEAFRPHIPLVTALRNPGMRERHWESISTKIGIELNPEAEGFTLQDALDSGLPNHVETIQKVSEVAAKEYSIETKLKEMSDDWQTVQLQIDTYRDTGTCILKGIDEYFERLDEHITTTQAMTFSAFKGPFEEQIEEWNTTLQTVSEVIDEWVKLQRNWLYLQPIFESPDINKQLPVEGKRFATVDKNWRQTMVAAKGGVLAIKFCNDIKLLERFRESNKLLDTVTKGISDYLETKRAGFSRFYFLSDGDLLSILSETKDPTNVQPHLGKCFEAIKSVTFEESLEITAMKSAEGEIVPFAAPVNPKHKNIEDWMVELENSMKSSVRAQMASAVQDYLVIARTEWMQKWPGMIVLNGSQVHWTAETEAAFKEGGNQGIQEYHKQLVQQLSDMVMLIRTGLSSQLRTTVGALAVIDVHARDVNAKMIKLEVTDTADFQWISQMRFYWEGDFSDGDLFVVMVTSKRPYGYEYLGNSFRLVITPLTDKCYLTLMGALQMILGGAPQGPAGTGKTETTKDLAKALAKQCVVFNCGDGIDYKMMAKFFKGLASCGAWACFDEFNRINLEVLSVIAQQILTLQVAVQGGELRLNFEESEIVVNPEFCVFITMNPGYAGRSELPDNLEALFRPVAMMVPDYALIGEIMFFAYGYLEGRLCGKKMVATFTLCSEQLSSQDHYDYGMRAVKTVITAAGNLKRSAPEEKEEALLLRALQDVNVPKFLAHDLPLFWGILSDLFPGVERPAFDYGPLLVALKQTIENKNLQATPIFMRKCIELYEMICVRHGLMVVGPTGGGKSSVIRTLADALALLKSQGEEGIKYEKTIIDHLNPKAITMGQLYGSFDANTHEWQDGILAGLIRDCIRNDNDDLKWTLFDGPVDAIWIESMNTVLDDNKKLCLNSGEMMSLSPQMTMMYEPEDLAVASPATVSRCGMIYMEPTSLGIDPLVQSWMNKLPAAFGPAHRRKLQLLMTTHADGLLTFVRRHVTQPFPTVSNMLLDSLLKLLDCYFEPYHEKEGREPKADDEIEGLLVRFEPLFIFCAVWSLCATADEKGRKLLDAFIRSNMVGVANPVPNDGLVYDFFYNLEEDKWIKWMDTTEPYTPNMSLDFSEIIVPTSDSVRYTYLLDTLVTQGKHVWMTGPTGTGKSVNINRHLQTGLTDKFVPICITFSAQTSANQVQDLLDAKMEKRRKGIFGPQAGKKFIIFVDDANMPMKEEYGAQPPIEILRQWFDNSGWFDRKLLEFRKIIDVIFVAACGPPGGGRNSITARFPRHFNMIGYNNLEHSSMTLIFETILSAFLVPFAEDISALAAVTTSAAIGIYDKIVLDLLPTPAKPHYQYNLRDLSKIFQGMLMMDKKKVSTVEEYQKMVIHEHRRVFGDRLTNDADKVWFEALLAEKLGPALSFDYAAATADSIICADYLVPGADPRVYELVKDASTLKPLIDEYLGDYNAETKQPMLLVMFMNAIEHVSRISRVFRQPQGNALLLGVGGSGRQSLSRLAAAMADFDLYQIEITKGYGKVEWAENLRECLLKAGIENKPMVFLFNDTQIVFEGMLEDINNILNTGDVPNLYGPEEMDTILTACKIDCTRKKILPTKLNIFSQYLSRVRRNIHLVLCMSPLGDAFRERLRKFPSVVNCCTIDWFSEWPAEALKSVAKTAMTEGTDMQLGDAAEGCMTTVQSLHQSVSEASKQFLDKSGRYNYVTPTSYLELLATYKAVLGRKREEVGTMKSRLQNGLDKLISTAEQVAGLQEKLTALEPHLVKTGKEVEDMIVNITRDKKDAAVVAEDAGRIAAAAADKETETKAIADDAQRDLDEALPALEEAVESLKSLKKSDVDEVKSMGNPPHGVKLTMEACCIMFEIKPIKENDPNNPMKKVNNYFKAAQQTLLSRGPRLIEDMKDYDKDNIKAKVITAIGPYVQREDFDPKLIEKASKACTAMCKWVRAMHKYHEVSVQVEPKRKLLAEASASLEITRAELEGAKKSLKIVTDRIEALEADFAGATARKAELETQVTECRGRLDRAQKLIGGLGGERTRWTEACAILAASYANLVGDCLVSSGMIAYSGPFTPEFRTELVGKWQGLLRELDIPHTPGCDIKQTMSNPVTVRQWALYKLPSDNHSTENGVIMTEGRRYPLFIDPQTQANRFIKNMGKDPARAENGIETIKLSDKNFLRTLENGVRFGKWVLLENIGETIDAVLEPLLLQQKFKQGGTEMIRLGDSTIPWNDTFRFYMTTKLPNPHYAPEVCVKVSLINFAITPSGLEDQLLGSVVVEERPDMEEKKNSLTVSNARMKKELKDLEDKILYMLSNSTGNILDDVELIEMLSVSKKTSQDITAKVAEAEIAEKEIDETREKYRPVAYRATTLYFTIVDLATVDPMYQYSLQWFTSLFVTAVRAAEASDDMETRLTNLKEHFTYYLYLNICRGLFEQHKLLFSFLMVINVMKSDDKIDENEWQFLVTAKNPDLARAAGKSDMANPSPDDKGGWITLQMWEDVRMLSTLKALDGFDADFAKPSLLSEWQSYFDHAEPHNLKLPGTWDLKLNLIQKMCVLRCVRQDKIPEMMMNFVIETVGVKFVEPPPFNLEACYADSSPVTPLIFVLSKGSDPTKAFLEFAQRSRFDKKLRQLSLGQGQGEKASRMIEEALQKGQWVYLQNCHLFVSWLETLEQIVENMSPDLLHKDFRLWLTSMPTDDFPVSVLQSGVKMTNEPPKGLKANLRLAYFKLDNDRVNSTSKPAVYRKLLFALCFFHASVQERRKFGPLGWNIPYAFNDTDLDISRGQLEMYLDTYDETPWDVLNLLTAQVNYGGRVTDAKDIRTIDVIMKFFYNPHVLEEGNKFDPDGVYVPITVADGDEENSHQAYCDYIETLPMSAPPGVFGMHENANITCALNESYMIFDTIASLQAEGGGGGGSGREDGIIASAADIEKRLMVFGAFNIEAVGMQYPVLYEESMNTVLLQECVRYNNLVNEMVRSLPLLQRALKGLVALSAELENMGTAISINAVPDNWTSKAYPSLKGIKAWTDELMERLGFLHKWIEKGVPTTFWISGFYFPQAFITGTKQNYARKYTFAIDSIDFDFIMCTQSWESIEAAPADGVYIRGMFLEGARWNPEIRSLDDSLPKQLYTPMPLIHLNPVKDRQPPTSGIYMCPVYKELSRRGVLSTTGHSTNFVIVLEIPSNRTDIISNTGQPDQEEWIKAGVAAFCALRY